MPLSEIKSNSQFKSIRFDHNGFAWIVCYDGSLLRWGGGEFRSVQVVHNNRQIRFFRSFANSKGKLFFMSTNDNGECIFTLDSSGTVVFVEDVRAPITGGCYRNDIFLSYNSFRIFEGDIRRHGFDPLDFFCGAKMHFELDSGRVISLYDSDCYLLSSSSFSKILFDSSLTKICFRLPNGIGFAGRSEAVIFSKGQYYVVKVDQSVSDFLGMEGFNGENRTYFLLKGSIFYIDVIDGVCRRVKLFDVPSADLQSGIRFFAINEKYKRAFLVTYDGRFFEAKLHAFSNVSSRRFLVGSGTVYSLSKKFGQVVTNSDLAHRLFLHRSVDYDTIGPVIGLRNDLFFVSKAGLYRFNRRLELVHADSVASSTIVKSAVSVGGRSIWFIGDSLGEYNTEQRVTSFVSIPGGVPATGGKYKWVSEFSTDSVCVATFDGLYLVDVRSKKIRQIATFCLEVEQVRDLYFSARHKSFILVTDRCARIIDLERGRISFFQSTPEVRSLHSFREDNFGRFWMPSNYGIYSMVGSDFLRFREGKIKAVPLRRFGEGDGLINEEFNGGFTNSVFTGVREFLFANMSGVVRLDLSAINSSWRIDGDNLFVFEIRVNDSLVPTSVGTLTAPAGFRSIEFDVDYVAFGSDRSGVLYRVLGSNDSTWRLIPEDGSVLIRTLPFGDYKIELVRNGRIAGKRVVLNFTVERYWFESISFYFVVCFILVLLLIGLYNWRVNALRARFLKAVDRNRRDFFLLIAHDLRTPLRSYQGLAESMVDLVGSNDFEGVRQVGNEVKLLGERISIILENILVWNRMNEGVFDRKVTRVDVGILLEEIIGLYVVASKRRGVHLSYEPGDVVWLNVDERLLSIVLRNLLDNCVKYCSVGGFVAFKWRVMDEGGRKMFLAEVSNSVGRSGIEDVSRLVRQIDDGDVEAFGGFGFRLIKAAIKNLEGEVSARLSVEGRTVYFYVRLPVDLKG